MKKAKRLVSLLLAVVMLLSLAVSAGAVPATPATSDTQAGDTNKMDGTDANGKITITNAKPGQTYKLYQVLYLESFDEKTGAYLYKENSKWATWLQDNLNGTLAPYIKKNDAGYIIWSSNISTRDYVQGFAQLLMEHAATMSDAVVA